MKTLAISAVCLSVLVASVCLTGCAEPYGTVGYVNPGYYGSGYDGRNYYASDYSGRRYYDTGYGTGYYGPGYYPGYASTGYVTVAVGDRPYYTRGAGYRVGPRYYTWRHGYWHRYNGRRVWVHGNYVIRG